MKDVLLAGVKDARGDWLFFVNASLQGHLTREHTLFRKMSKNDKIRIYKITKIPLWRYL